MRGIVAPAAAPPRGRSAARRIAVAVAWVALLCLSLPPGVSLAADTLVWSDEFDGDSIDSSSWEHMLGDGTAYGLPPGWGNNELQFYTDRPVNSFVADGFLHIVALREEFEGRSYTSARLRTAERREFLYGRFEARIKVPTGRGLWPALWMLPADWAYGGWAASGEVDIFETINVPRTVYGTIHFGGEWPANVQAQGKHLADHDLSSAFHVYAIEWTPDEIRWYLDDVHYNTVTSADWWSGGAPENDRAPFDQPFHLLINVAVGGNWPGPPDSTTSFPQEMLVDWIRVWELDGQDDPVRRRPVRRATSVVDDGATGHETVPRP